MSTERKTINIEDIKFMLANGVTRLKDDKHYNAELGSIEEHYGLDKEQVTLMFRDARLQGVRFKKVAMPTFILTEGERTITTLPRMQNTTVSTSTTTDETSEVEETYEEEVTLG